MKTTRIKSELSANRPFYNKKAWEKMNSFYRKGMAF